MNLALSHLGTATRAPANPHDTSAVWKVQPWMVERLLAAGWELDSHTLTHAHLTHIGPAGLAAQVGDSRAILRRRFGVPVDVFSYPYGEYDPAVIAQVASSGYLAAVTTRRGVASSGRDPYRLPRITISRGDGIAGLRSDLAAVGLPHQAAVSRRSRRRASRDRRGRSSCGARWRRGPARTRGRGRGRCRTGPCRP